MAKKIYRVLVLQDAETKKWEHVFGSYDKGEVDFERDDMRAYVPAKRLKIVTPKTARQSDVNAAIAALNH